MSILIRSGKREKKQETILQRVFGARSQAFERPPGSLYFLIQVMGNHGREPQVDLDPWKMQVELGRSVQRLPQGIRLTRRPEP